MAIIRSLDGKLTGKLGGRVYLVRNGQNIVRELNPEPFNPKSQSQIEARAKLKMLSQLAAVCAPVIAIPRVGAISSRNQFTTVNYSKTTYTNNEARIVVNDISLTRGTMGLPQIVLTREGAVLQARLAGNAGVGLDRVTYALFIKGKDNALRYAGSNSVSTPGPNNTFDTSFAMVDVTDTFVVLAYGSRFNNEAARVRYENLQADSAEQFAKLVVTRVLLESDVTLTETRGNTSLPA